MPTPDLTRAQFALALRRHGWTANGSQVLTPAGRIGSAFRTDAAGRRVIDRRATLARACRAHDEAGRATGR